MQQPAQRAPRQKQPGRRVRAAAAVHLRTGWLGAMLLEWVNPPGMRRVAHDNRNNAAPGGRRARQLLVDDRVGGGGDRDGENAGGGC